MNLTRLIFFIFVLSLGAVLYYEFLRPKNIELSYSATELHELFSTKFPLENKNVVLDVSLSNPTVELEEGGEEVGIFTSAKVDILGLSALEGMVKMMGKVHYRAATHELFLKSPRVVEIDILNLPEEYTENFEDMLVKLIDGNLKNIQIAKLQQDAYHQTLSEMKIEHFEIQEGILKIKLVPQDKTTTD